MTFSLRDGNKLYKLLQCRDSKQIKEIILKKRLSANYEFPEGSTPLHIAAEKHDVETVNFLLSLNIPPDRKNCHGETALMIAINQTHKAMQSCVIIHLVSALINKKCRVNLSDAQGRTALHLACSKGLPAVVRILINEGAKVNVQDKWGRNPLLLALLNMGNVSNQPLNHYLQVVKVLLSNNSYVNGESNIKNPHKPTPLLITVTAGDHYIEITKLLVKHGAEPDRCSRHNLTPLMAAVKKGYYLTTKFLVQYNCCVNQIYSDSSKTCFYEACLQGHLAVAMILLGAGVEQNLETWLFNEQADPFVKWKEKDRALFDWISRVSAEPLSLKAVSRNAVRRSLNTYIERRVAVLEYPQSLKSYLMLTDVFKEADKIYKQY